MFHALPKDEDGDPDDEMLMEWLTKVDLVFSIRKAVADELVPFLAGINEENRSIHKVYIPSYPVELFHIVQEQKGKKVVGTQNYDDER